MSEEENDKGSKSGLIAAVLFMLAALAVYIHMSKNSNKAQEQANISAEAPIEAQAEEAPAPANENNSSLAEEPNTDETLTIDEAVPSFANINFVYNAYDFKEEPNALPRVKELAKYLNENKGKTVFLSGHTDNRGGAEYNKKLAEQRVDAVRRYLVSNGIEASRISGQGYGQENPISSNAAADGRKQNRRVEIEIRQN